MDFFTEKEISSFNELEFEVYRYILKNKDKIPYMTIRELANESHVSTTTILRFCKKTGCDGFSEFKVRFKLALAKEKKQVLKQDDSIILQFLNRASTSEFQAHMDEVSKLMAKSKNLIFMGMGNSGIMAQYAARYFSSVGIFALHVDNPMFPIDLETPEETVLLVLSVEGETSTILQTVSEVKAGGATILSITNSQSCTLARLSDLNISYYVHHELNKTSRYRLKVDITTQFPAVYIIESLAKKTYNYRNQLKK